jgi:invasion protein IalB
MVTYPMISRLRGTPRSLPGRFPSHRAGTCLHATGHPTGHATKHTLRHAPKKWLRALCAAVLTTSAAAAVFAPIFAPALAQAAPEDGKTYKDWVIRCETPTGEAAERCFIVQNLVLKDQNQRVLLVAITYTAGKPNPVAVLTLPLGISLPPGITLRIDGGEPHRFAIERCVANGCKVGFILTRALLARFKAGLKAEILVHDASRSPINLPVSLRGFTAALAAIKQAT